MQETASTAPAKKRAPGLKWKRFHQLKRSDSFFIGQTLCIKVGTFRASSIKRGLFFIAPWRKVRSMEPVAKPHSVAISAPCGCDITQKCDSRCDR